MFNYSVYLSDGTKLMSLLPLEKSLQPSLFFNHPNSVYFFLHVISQFKWETEIQVIQVLGQGPTNYKNIQVF